MVIVEKIIFLFYRAQKAAKNYFYLIFVTQLYCFHSLQKEEEEKNVVAKYLFKYWGIFKCIIFFFDMRIDGTGFL